MPSGSCLSESVDIPLRSGQDSGWSEHDVRDRRSATWMSPRAVPVRIWDTISTSLGNSHSETLQLSEGILFVPGVRPVSQRSFTNFQVISFYSQPSIRLLELSTLLPWMASPSSTIAPFAVLRISSSVCDRPLPSWVQKG